MKTEFKGTKGEWTSVKGTNKYWIESNLWTVADITPKDTFNECEANAKLIAAAPELLEALQDLVEYNSIGNQAKARLAIKKALGE